MWLFIAVLLPLATLQSSSGAAVDEQTSARHKRDSENKVDLTALKDHLASLEDGLSKFQKRSCQFGINSAHCQLDWLDNVMNMADYLASGHSPGKRSSQLPADVSAMAEALIQNLNEQRREVVKLRGVLDQLGEDTDTKKRTCEFRLGNHCLTEALDRAATQYFWLKSPHSPGTQETPRSWPGLAPQAPVRPASRDTIRLLDDERGMSNGPPQLHRDDPRHWTRTTELLPRVRQWFQTQTATSGGP